MALFSITTASQLFTVVQWSFTLARIIPGVGDPAIKKEGTPAPSVCYNCSQPGHVARNYPLLKYMTDIKEMGEVEEITNIKNISGNKDI